LNTFEDGCEALQQTLLKIGAECKAVSGQVETFQTNTTTIPLRLVSAKLLSMERKVLSKADILSKAHGGQGVVFMRMDENGLGLYWGDKECSVEDVALWKAQGSLVLSLDLFSEIIQGLIAQLKFGQWAVVLEFINKYRTFID
jgi:hypothetical protein